MLQAWIMRGLCRRSVEAPAAGVGTAFAELVALLDEAGFTSVVATNCEQDYVRELRAGGRGELRRASSDDVSAEKQTGLGRRPLRHDRA